MTAGDRFQILLGVMGIVLIPILIMFYRGIVKWTRTEDKLNELLKDVNTLITDKDKVHAAMFEQMTKDRAATDKRLRWLEEHYWKGRE
jgi:hypothetical protein